MTNVKQSKEINIIVSRMLIEKIETAHAAFEDNPDFIEALNSHGIVSFYNEGETDIVFEAGAELGWKAIQDGLSVVVSYGEETFACVAENEEVALALVDQAIASVLKARKARKARSKTRTAKPKARRRSK